MIPAHWELIVTGKDIIGCQRWDWKSEDADKAWRIFEAYKNTVKGKSAEVYQEENGYVRTDYGTVTLTYQVEKKEPKSTESGIMFCPYIENIFLKESNGND